MRRLLTDLRSGLGSVVLISGPAGSGKTALMSAVVDMARREGVFATVTSFSRIDQRLVVERDEHGAEEPRLLCFDDLHHADEGAVREIMNLALNPRDAPVLLLLLTLRPTPRHPLWEWRSKLQRRTYCHWLSLESLSTQSAAAIATKQFGITPDTGTVVEALGLSNGNLALFKAIFADYVRYQDEYGPPERLSQVLGPDYRRAVLDHYYQFEASTREVAQAVATLGEYAGPRAVAEVADVTVDEVDQAMTELTAAGLVKDGDFRQAGMAAVMAAELSVQQASVLNRRAASVLRDLGAPAIRVARHLIDADHVDETWTGFLLGEAHAQATAVRDRQTAIDVQRLALRGTQADAERARILVDLALAHAATDPELCSQYLHEAGALVPEDDLWRWHPSVLSDQFTRRGRAREAIARLASIAAQADAPLEADRLMVLGEVPELIAAHDTVGRRMPGDLRYDAASSLMRTLTSARPDPVAVQMAKDVLFGSALTENTASQHLVALTTLVYSGELDLARALTDPSVLEAPLQGGPVWRARLIALRAEISLRVGDYAACTAEALDALRLMPDHAWGVRVGGPLAAVLLGFAAGEARTGVNLASPPAGIFETRYGLHYLYARGQLNLADGNAHAALADLVGCGSLMARWGVDHEHLLPWRLAAAGAMLWLGDRQGAIGLIDERFDRIKTAEVKERQSAREEVFHRLHDAVRSGRLVEEVRLIASGGPGGRAGEPAARYKIEDRFSHYLNKLSLAEQHVALRAAQGQSNRHIARALSVSVSTVEQHLTKVYRKLGLSGRPDLRARLG